MKRPVVEVVAELDSIACVIEGTLLVARQAEEDSSVRQKAAVAIAATLEMALARLRMVARSLDAESE